MSDFWTLWNKADAGDYAALWEVNVLVAEKAGLKIYRAGTIDADAVPGYVEGIGWLQEWISNAAGEAAPIPDYMSDLNAAFNLNFPPHGRLDIYRDCVDGVYQNWNVRADGDFKSVIHASSNIARALVAAWWAAVTGEVQP